MAAASSSRTFDDDFDYSKFIWEEEIEMTHINNNSNSINDGWKTVTSKKKKKSQSKSNVVDSGSVDENHQNDVFRGMELQAEERRKRMLLAGKGHVVVDDYDDKKNYGGAALIDDKDANVGGGVVQTKKKARKLKKAKVINNKKKLTSESNDKQKMTLKDTQNPCKQLLNGVTGVNRCVKVSLVVAMVIGISATYLAFNDGLLYVFLA